MMFCMLWSYQSKCTSLFYILISFILNVKTMSPFEGCGGSDKLVCKKGVNPPGIDFVHQCYVPDPAENIIGWLASVTPRSHMGMCSNGCSVMSSQVVKLLPNLCMYPGCICELLFLLVAS